MGVYKSVTEPKVQRKSASETFTSLVVESAGEEYIKKRLRKRFGAPRKTPVSVVVDEHGNSTFRLDWFEVETFN